MRKSLIVFLLIIFFSGFGKIDLSLQNEIEFSLKRALNWLVNEQEEDGSWMHYPAITGLSVLSILRSNEGLTADFEPVAKGLSFILDCVQLDGSIHAGELPNYNTAICLLAFKEADDGRFADIIDGAEKYLLRIQLDEEEGFTPDSLYYGGIGYDGSDNRPDLSNLNWVMEALVERQTLEIEKSDKPEVKNQTAKKLFYDKALLFLRRCQNLQEYNPMDYAEDDGGFIYEVGKSKAGGVNSYGSMTYIGLKSMIYAELGQTDPRVTAAYDWIRHHYTLETTPRMGNQGLFYYYLVMARSLSVYGEDTLIDSEGKSHNWREELADQLIKIQNEEGWWQNENGRWRENSKILVTTYCILSLEELLKTDKF
jgi:squalene-hopene/tetraprenyl-beta-curcumene cyclase